MSTLTKEDIITLLMTNDKAVERAVVVLFERQTQSEQSSESTHVHNGEGFTPFDAHIMSGMAKWVLRGRPLTPKQLAFLRRGTRKFPSRIGKYAGQLLKIAEAKAASNG